MEVRNNVFLNKIDVQSKIWGWRRPHICIYNSNFIAEQSERGWNLQRFVSYRNLCNGVVSACCPRYDVIHEMPSSTLDGMSNSLFLNFLLIFLVLNFKYQMRCIWSDGPRQNGWRTASFLHKVVSFSALTCKSILPTPSLRLPLLLEFQYYKMVSWELRIFRSERMMGRFGIAWKMITCGMNGNTLN